MANFAIILLEKWQKKSIITLEKRKTMLKRKIERYLVDFFKKSKKSLLITGARQIGKTFSIREYGKNNFDSFVEINFIDMPEAKELIKNANSSKDILGSMLI